MPDTRLYIIVGIAIVTIVLMIVLPLKLSGAAQEKSVSKPAACESCYSQEDTSLQTQEYYRQLVEGQEFYPLNDARQVWNSYGGIKAGATPSELCAKDAIQTMYELEGSERVNCILDRSHDVFKKNRHIDIFGVLM